MKHGENCICTGGTYTIGTNGCKTHDDLADPTKTKKICKYRVSYDYVGTCSDVP